MSGVDIRAQNGKGRSDAAGVINDLHGGKPLPLALRLVREIGRGKPGSSVLGGKGGVPVAAGDFPELDDAVLTGGVEVIVVGVQADALEAGEIT